MNQREIEKHLFFQIAFIVFIIVTMAFTIFWLLTENVSAAEMKVNCSSSDKSNCVGLFQGNNATSINTNVITNYSTTSSYRYFTITSMPLEISTKYTFKISYWPGTRTINNIFFKWYYTDINNNTQTINGYANASYQPSWINDLSVNVATFTLTTSDYYRNSTSNFINLDFGSSGVIIKKIEITSTEVQNTNDIIQRVQEIAQSYTCPIGPLVINANDWVSLGTNNKHLDSTGAEVSDNNSIISPFMVIHAGTYIINYNGDLPNTYYACTYTANKQIRNCYQYINTGNGANLSENVITATNYDAYLRVSVRKSRAVKVTGQVCNDWEKEAQDRANSILDDTNSYLKDDSDPSINNSAISDTIESVAVNDPLNYLLTLPLHTIQRINYHLSRNSCSPINLGSLYGTDLILPCINIKDRIGESLFNTIDILMAIGIGSVTLKKFYDSISNVLTLGKEKEVREKLELPTPMEFFAMIFGGGR